MTDAERLRQLWYTHYVTTEEFEGFLAQLEAAEARIEELEEDDAARERWNRTVMEAAEAIRTQDKWPEKAWPSMNERAWYVAAQARVRELEAALHEGLDHMHPITCASIDGFEDSGKPCDCWHSRARAALAPTQRDT